jgi:hypothetical protein
MPRRRYTLVLDIDETLGHCFTRHDEQGMVTPESNAIYALLHARAMEEEAAVSAKKMQWHERRVFDVPQAPDSVFLLRPGWFTFAHEMIMRHDFDIIIWSAGTFEYVQYIARHVLFPRPLLRLVEKRAPLMLLCRDHVTFESEHFYHKPLDTIVQLSICVPGFQQRYGILDVRRLILVDNLISNGRDFPMQFVHVPDYAPKLDDEINDNSFDTHHIAEHCLRKRTQLRLRHRLHRRSMTSRSRRRRAAAIALHSSSYS